MARKPCASPGCHHLTDKRFCDKHTAEQRKADDRRRGDSTKRGYDQRWAKARLAFLSVNQLCLMCSRDGVTTAATVVDHIMPHKGDHGLFWDENNWQPLCKYHHDRKTAEHDGAFRYGG